MANPPKPWKAEYAKSARSSCKSCKSSIGKDVLRLGKMVVATQFDGFMPAWNHAACIFKKANQIKSVDDVEGIDLLRWEDQQKIKAYIESASSSVNDKSMIEASKTSRSTCGQCNEKIMKGMVRISLKPIGQGAKGQTWYHVKCFIEESPSTVLDRLPGWDNLSIHERKDVSALVTKGSSINSKDEFLGTKGETSQKVASKGTKRRKDSKEYESKTLKAVENTSAGELSRKGAKNSAENISSASDLETKLEEQTKSLWAIKDELKRSVTVRELREMLEANGQDPGGAEYDLRERCADGMLFGALDKCPLCSGSLVYSGGQYRCHGYLSAWSKCNYSTTEAVRLKNKWKIPEETSNQFLCKWFKSQEANKPNRILPPYSNKSPIKNAVNSMSQPSIGAKLKNLKVALTGELQEALGDLKCKLESVGVAVHAKIKKDTSCLVVCGQVESDPEIRKARRMKLPIVREDYLSDCISEKKMLPFDRYLIETLETSGSSMVTVKVKGQSAVHESSGLQDTGHILEDGKSIYNTTLNMSDLSTGVNSYYILQVIEEDKGSDCYVFRKWGRVGNDRIGGIKLEEMSKSDAIRQFKHLFLEKTGNPWEAWEQRQNFEKQPGRFFPLDIDYGVKQMPKKQDRSNEKSTLAPKLADLMKMLFNVETYRAAMMEFEINMSEMPLGKLSKQNIQKGFEALTEIQNILNDKIKYSCTEKESLIINASNRFFTLIPSIHPHIIKDEDDFKMKVKMLEALQDIEIASRLVGFDCETSDSLDDKYQKLNCDVVPLPHESEDYKLVEHYLLTTHAPTHKEWSLELEDVFTLERKGESDRYTKYRAKLQNKMLLWHGSRLTNFVGILSRGLRIAPPEAPATGYMFGKGIYFADLVSKSAQYCFVDKKNPVGLLLLSEVALGKTFELKKSSYMDKPPTGKHSTKGLGKTMPLESEYVKWKDEVVVPCGKPVSSSVRASELLYNEYIVYDTAQVKMQFLLKVRFHHKR